MSRSDDRLFSGLVHLSIFLQGLGIFVALIIYMLQRQRSSFVARHAMQSLIYQVAVFILVSVLGILGIGGVSIGMMGQIFHPHTSIFGFGFLFALLILVLEVILPIWASIQGFQGRSYRYPVIGKYTDRLL
ncbi:MAG: DUF4870 domain-containing protein [Bacillaceae bacterium]|nr:DUF4870 domain-containing protein [Bacillaceae bacterium]